jgi:hypothetical protein
MSTGLWSRRIAIAAGGTALVAMGTLTACSPTKEKEATPATSSSSPATPSATEKALLPGNGPSFSPTINPVPPGATCKSVVNGVCQR